MPAHSTPLMPPAPQGEGNPLNPEGRSERSRADCCGLAEVPVRCLAGETFILLAKYLGKLPDLLAASEAAIGAGAAVACSSLRLQRGELLSQMHSGQGRGGEREMKYNRGGTFFALDNKPCF